MSGVWTAAAIATLAAGTTYYNTQQTAKRQDNQLAASLRNQAALQREADAKTGDLIQKTAQSTEAPAKASLLGDFMRQVQASTGNATRPLNQVGNVSDAYTRSANDAALGVGQYGADRAQLLSNIDAPGLQRQGEAADLSRYGSQINAIKRDSQADQFLNQIKLGAIHPNPWLSAAAAGMSAYAGSGGTMRRPTPTPDNYSQGRTMGTGFGYTVNMPDLRGP